METWRRLWAPELNILMSMGFEDPERCVDVLKGRGVKPSSLSQELNGVPEPETMQEIIAELLRSQNQ
jgi:hypothetical protein